MILHEFGILASDTARTKAYLQAMICEEKLPGICVVYSEDISKMLKEADEYKILGEREEYFDIKKPVISYLNENDITYILVEDKDINSKKMESVLKGLEQKYLIYSGYGGYILKSHLFEIGKKFIHVHAGILPQYRGSTTAYYSFLQEKVFGATAIFLNEGIDEGEIITQETFEAPKKNVDIDYIFEPFIRSKVLIKAIDQYLKGNGFISHMQENKGAETYFIIHPVLKHLALLGIEKRQNEQS